MNKNKESILKYCDRTANGGYMIHLEIPGVEQVTRRLVFVYGTLLRGHHNNRLLNTSVFIDKGSTYRAVMYAAAHKGFPYLHVSDYNPIDSWVVGEVWAVDNETLLDLDRLEGYHEDAQSTGYNHYNRIKISVEISNECYVDALVYVVADVSKLSELEQIKSGDWNAYTKKQMKVRLKARFTRNIEVRDPIEVVPVVTEGKTNFVHKEENNEQTDQGTVVNNESV